MMKKSIVRFVVVAVLISAGLQSRAQGFYGGVRGGMNVSSLTKTSGAKSVVRGNVGGFVGFQIGSVVGIQAEALYSFQGAQVDLYNYMGVDLHMDYLKIPLLVKIYLIKGLNIEAGASFNILTSALLSGKSAQGYNGFDFSIPVGVAYQFGKHFEVGMRYDISCAPYHSDSDGTNSLFSLNVAWRF